MKKGFAYFFLFIFLCNSMGSYLVFELDKFLVKKEMRALIRTRRAHNQFLVLKVFQPERNPDFQRIETREIRFKGSLYDILKETKQGSITTFICMQDHKEELLIAGFRKAQNRKVTLAILHHLITQALPVELNCHMERTSTLVLFPRTFTPLRPAFLALMGHPPETA